MAVNGRPGVHPDLSTPENPYLGNAIVYALVRVTFQHLSMVGDRFIQCLAHASDAIAESNSPRKIDCFYVSEIYSLAERSADYRAIFPGWDLFGSRDLTITSWADLGLYEVDFGAAMGISDFVRIPESPADGVCIVMPRRKSMEGAESEEMVEVVVILKKDDMDTLEQDSDWKSIIA